MLRFKERNANGDIIHAQGPEGDRTLCGYACEGECNGIAGYPPLTSVDRGRVNCADCITVIMWCRDVTNHQLAPRGQRRSAVR